MRDIAEPLVTLNDLLWLLYLYPIRLLARVLPRWSLYFIGKLSDPAVQFHARRRKAKAALWIEQACATTPARARRIAGQSLTNNMFRVLDELVLLRPSSDEMLCCTGIDGLPHLEDAIARGKGVILTVGHFCANRIAVRYLAARGYAALSVHNQRPLNRAGGRFGRQFLQPRSIRLQQRANPDQVYIQDPDCSLKIMRRLRSGGLVVLQVDGAGGTKIVEHAFLGVPWRVPSGIYEIVRVLECAVVPMLCLGRSTGFEIRFGPALATESALSRDSFVSANLPRVLAIVEKQITENPEEWRLWNHY
jgi:phosphatidylinositol dimannoside acyltransferase